MGKTFNASVDWLGMVENPDQDVNPSVNGEKAQTGIEFEAPKRDGERINSDGSESTHIMKTETIDGINWVSFPTLFQNEDGTWDDTYELMIKKNPDNWKPAMLEAKRRGELIHFGPNKKEALEYGKGSWKPKAQNGKEQTDSILGVADIGIPTDPARQEIYSDVDEMLKNYLKSDSYLNRLTNQGYTNPENTQKLRLDALENIKVQETEGFQTIGNMLYSMPNECKDEYGEEILTGECGKKWATWKANVQRSGSMTHPVTGEVLMDANQITGMNDQFGPIYAHEVGHNIGASFPNTPVTGIFSTDSDQILTDKTLNYNDAYLLNTTNKLWQEAPWRNDIPNINQKGSLNYLDAMGIRPGREGKQSYVPGTLGYGDKESRGYYFPRTKDVVYPPLERNLIHFDEDDPGVLIETDPDNNIYAPNPNYKNYSSDHVNLEDVASQMTKWQQANAYAREMRKLHGRDSEEFKNANAKADELKVAFLESDALTKGYPTGEQITFGDQKKGPIHKIGASESYSDLTGLRYFAHKNLTNPDGSAWTPDQELTPELWEQLVAKYKQDLENGIENLTFKRMMERYGEDGKNIIMNHNLIADTKEIDHRQIKYGGDFKDGGPTSEREKYIQFALDTESGYHYIRNKDSAVKKLGADGKWDGKTYYKIYEDGKYYPHYVGDEKRATIGHGHAPVDRDIFEEYKEGITETQALELLGKDIDEKLRLSEIYYNSRFGDCKWDDLTESEQFMLNDYTFNVRGGFHKTFRNFAKAIHDKDHELAKKEYKRALGERNVIFMDRYLKPWMDIQIEKTTVAPPLEDMPLPIGVFPTDSEGNPQSMSTNPNKPKKETSWWRGEEGWIPDELELPWFMDGAGINARGNTPSSVTDIPATADGSRAENATMSRSAMDPMPSLNNDLTVNDNLALDNTISDLSEETNIPQVKYGGQYMWGLDLRSTKAQAGKEVKSDDIYANDRYSQSAAKYKKMLPKYQTGKADGRKRISTYTTPIPQTDNYTLNAGWLPEVEVIGKDPRNWFQRNYQDYISPIGHGTLDVLGMIPLFGEPADGLNALWYAGEGNYLDAGLTSAAMIPFFGWGATTGKWAKNTIKSLNEATPGGGDMYLQMKRINEVAKKDMKTQGGFMKKGKKFNKAKEIGIPQSDRKIKKMIKNNPEEAQKLIDEWNISSNYSRFKHTTPAISSHARFLDNVKLRTSRDAMKNLDYFGRYNQLPNVLPENILSYTSKIGDDGTTTLFRYGKSPLNIGETKGWFSADPFDPFHYRNIRRYGDDGKVFKIDVDNNLLNEIYRGGPQQNIKGLGFESGTQFKEFEVPDWLIEISNKKEIGNITDYKKYLGTLKKYGGQK